MPSTIERRDSLTATLVAERGIQVHAHDLTVSTPLDFVTLQVGGLMIVGAADDIRYLLTLGIGQMDRLDAERILDAERRCVDGTHSHPLSLVEDLGAGRSAVECTACNRSFVQEGDGTLTPVVDGLLVGGAS